MKRGRNYWHNTFTLSCRQARVFVVGGLTCDKNRPPSRGVHPTRTHSVTTHEVFFYDRLLSLLLCSWFTYKGGRSPEGRYVPRRRSFTSEVLVSTKTFGPPSAARPSVVFVPSAINLSSPWVSNPESGRNHVVFTRLPNPRSLLVRTSSITRTPRVMSRVTTLCLAKF